MPQSRILIGIGGDQNDAVMKFQRDATDNGYGVDPNDIDIMAFELNVSNSTVTADYLVIDGGTY